MADARPARVAWTSPLLAVGAALCALGAWWFLPQGAAEAVAAPALRVVVVDASASCAGPRPRWIGEVLRCLEDEARAAQGAGQEIAVVRQDAGAERVFGPAPPEDLIAALFRASGDPLALEAPPEAALGSDLAAAIDLAGRLFAGVARPPGEVVVFGDGTWTGADPGDALARLAAAGHRVRRVPPAAATTHQLALLDWRAPERIAGGAPLAAIARVAWTPPPGAPCADATLTVVAEGMGQRSERVLPLVPPADARRAADGRIEFDVRVEWPPRLAGNHVLQARVDHPQDRVAGDDARARRLRVADAPTVLLVSRDGVRARAQVERLQPFLPGLVLEASTLAEAALRLPDAAAVWTLDLGPVDLPTDAWLGHLRGGGGWFATGTDGLLRGFGRGPLAEVLPLELREHPDGPRDVVVAVDGSGSMRGEPFERVRAAIGELVLGLPARDDLELRLFQLRLGRAIVDARGDDPESLRRAVRDLLEATVPGGATGIPQSVEDFVATREGDPRRSLVVWMTDGHSTVGEGELTARHRARLDAVRAEPIVLAVGTPERPADLAFLRPLLRPGESIVDAGDLSELGTLLVDRVRSESLASAARVRWVAGAEHVEGTWWRDWIEAATGPTPAAFVGRSGARLDVQARPGAHTVWRAEDRALLAVRDALGGRVAACGTGPAASPELFADPLALAPLLRTLARPTERRARPRATLVDGRLRVDGVPSDWPLEVTATLGLPVPGIEAGLGVPDLPLGTTRLRVPRQDPGGDPRSVRLGDLPAAALTRPAGEVWSLRVEGAPGPDLSQRLPAPPAAEFLAAPLGPLPAPAAAGAAGGAPGPHPAAPWVLGAGWALLVLAGLLPRVSGQGSARVRR